MEPGSNHARVGRPSLAQAQAARVVEGLRRLLLDRYGGTQVALARALGVGQPTVSSLLSGKDRPSYQTAERVAKLLRVPVAELLAGATGGDEAVLTERLRLRVALATLGQAVAPATRAAVLRAAVALPDLSVGTWTAVLLDDAHKS